MAIGPNGNMIHPLPGIAMRWALTQVDHAFTSKLHVLTYQLGKFMAYTCMHTEGIMSLLS